MAQGKECVIYLAQSRDYFVPARLPIPFWRESSEKEGTPYYYEKYTMSAVTEEEIDKCVKYTQKQGKHCVIVFEDSVALQGALINERLGYPSPSPLSHIYCANKVLTRHLVNEFDWFFGFNLKDDIETWIHKVKSYPCMLKATMLGGGEGSFRCSDEAALRTNLKAVLSAKGTCRLAEELQNEALKFIGDFKGAENCTQYMVEEFVQTKGTDTRQLCMEAFVTEDGEVIPYSLVEEFFFTNGGFLGHIIPPIHFDGNFQACDDYIINIGKKLYQLGFKNQAFNIEFWRFSDGKLRLIEINPRSASPYFYLYLEYASSNLLDDVSDLFFHGKLPAYTPLSKTKEQWSSGKSDMKYTALIDLASITLGKASDIFNFDLIDRMEAEGTKMHLYTPRDHVMTEMNQVTVGTRFCSYVLKELSWNEIVRSEKNIRKKFYKDFSQCEEAKYYPDFFIET